MPAPVTFNISIAPLPSGTFTPQQIATAIADRLTVTPAAPWSSFQNGGSIPLSDVGPVLLDGQEWRVFNTGSGAYTYHRQNGAGLVDNTVPLSKLTAGTAGSILIYDGSGRPVELPTAGAVDGQVLTRVGGMPLWANTYVPAVSRFETTLTADQGINTSGSPTLLNFNLVRDQATVTFDTANKRIACPANSFWFFYCALELEDTGAASTDLELNLEIRPNGGAGGVCQKLGLAAVPTTFGMFTAGILPFTSAGFTDVALSVDEATPVVDGVTVKANATNTRFGGFRIL